MPPPRSALATADERTKQNRPPGSLKYGSSRPDGTLSHSTKSRTLSDNAVLTSPSSHTNSSISQEARPGDPQWLRVMETKENQWRLMNSLALHELHAMERTACTELDELSSRLKVLAASVSELEATVTRCRARRARQLFSRIAAPKLSQLADMLESIRIPHAAACHAVTKAARALPLEGVTMSSQEALVEQLERFRDVATRFREKSLEAKVPELLDDFDALEELANVVVSEETAAVTCAAEAVSEAAVVVECERTMLAKRVVELRASIPFANDLSFVE